MSPRTNTRSAEFAELLDTAYSSSLGQITHALSESGGQHRTNEYDGPRGMPGGPDER